jgi:hypothetical protein
MIPQPKRFSLQSRQTIVLAFCALATLVLAGLSQSKILRVASMAGDKSQIKIVTANGTQNPSTGCCGGNDGDQKPHRLAGSYYTLNKNFNAKLLLNNKGPKAIQVQPTLFSLRGERFEVPPVTAEANAHQFINLATWVAIAGDQFREGSIQIFHRGRDLVLGTQIYLTEDNHSQSFEEKLTELGKGASSRLEGVWWLPSPKGEVRLVLSNTTDLQLSTSIGVLGENPKREANMTLNLMPHETRLLDVQGDIIGRKQGAMSRVGAISVEHNGVPNAVLARAMAMEMDDGYSLPVQFSDPAAAKSTNIQGAGLRVGKAGNESLAAKVVLHNASQTEMTVSGGVPYALQDGSTGAAQFAELQLLPRETKVVDVTQSLVAHGVRRNEVTSAGLEFQYVGSPGTLITAAFSVSESGDQVFRVPLWDIAAQRSATGGYPWYIEDGSSTIVYIKNVTTQPRQFRLYLMFEGGSYLYPLTTIAPGQTTTIDIRALRDEQVADINGQKVPLTETSGQVQWSMTGGEDRVLIGRSEQADLVHGISTNYACINCCGNSFYSGWISPEEASLFEGNVTSYMAIQQDANCYGQPFSPYQASSFFNSIAPSICSFSLGGTATGVGPGDTTIQGSWTADAWFMGLNEQCDYTPQEIVRDAFCTTCTGPTGETTAFSGTWADSVGYPTAANWTQTLEPSTVNFSGRTVTESNPGGGGPDNCWFANSEVAPATSISGGSWVVTSSNTWGPDVVGRSPSAVTYYRQQGRAPCSTTLPQALIISCPSSFPVYYKTTVLGNTIGVTTVTSMRAGSSVSRAWP